MKKKWSCEAYRKRAIKRQWAQNESSWRKKKSIQEKKSGKCFYRWPRKLLRRNLQLQHFDVVGAALPSCSCSCCCRLVEVCIVLCRIARYTKNDDDEEPKSSNNRRLRGGEYTNQSSRVVRPSKRRRKKKKGSKLSAARLWRKVARSVWKNKPEKNYLNPKPTRPARRKM